MTTAIAGTYRSPQVGELLRLWRERRRLSQLELASYAQVSARHLSFLETGRARPSRDMVLRLTDQLDVPLRDRNDLLLAAGYAPAYPETSLTAPQMSSVRTAVRSVLAGHAPYPAVVVDRDWNIVDANPSLSLFTDLAAPEVLAPPVNTLRLALHPLGMAPWILNLGEWRAHLLGRVRRRVAADGRLADLYAELSSYPCDEEEPEVAVPGAGDIFVPLRLRVGDRELSFFCMVATFGTPRDVTVAELTIESFFPADATTTDALRSGG
ncbi:helix-turn-helix domain-containing protein [Parafrankia sp. FMc2]|uniref:helix-turn-helix domain-containing protein n=1 Tax=Parafrankia sp. FMc2 TaxID=3233196 RepID=UPI0034D42D4A